MIQVRPGGAQVISLTPGAHASGPVAPASWWEIDGQTCVAAYQPKGAASLAASYTNLANPSVSLTEISAPALGAAGWVCNGDTVLDTGIVPGIGYSYAIRVASVTPGTTTSAPFGIFSSNTERLYVFLGYFGFHIYANGASSSLVKNGELAAGIFGIAGNQAYLNGTPEGAIPQTIASFAVTVYLGALRTDGYTAQPKLVGTIAAYAMYSTTLSAADMAELATRMSTI